MDNKLTREWKVKTESIDGLLSSIEDCVSKKHSLVTEREELTRLCYSSLCEFVKLDLNKDEDPMERLEMEKRMLKEKIENLETEITNLNDGKEDLKAKLCSKKSELRKWEEMKDDSNLGIDLKSKNKFKVLSKLLNVSYQTDADSQATAALIKDVNRRIRFDDHSRSKEQKMNEFWRIMEFIDRNHRA